MQVIDLVDPDLVTVFCPFCGTQTLSDEGEPVPCAHLVYVSSSETPDDPWYETSHPCRYEGDEEDSIVDMLAGSFPSADHVLFLLSSPAPAGLEVYVLYTHRGEAQNVEAGS